MIHKTPPIYLVSGAPARQRNLSGAGRSDPEMAD